MLPSTAYQQLPQNKLSGLSIAYGQGVWGALEDGGDGYNFVGDKCFVWRHDKNHLEQDYGIDLDALMDCVDQIEDSFGSPDDTRSQLGLLTQAGHAYRGLVVASRIDPRIICNFVPTSVAGSPVEAYFEWYLKDVTDVRMGDDMDGLLAQFDSMTGSAEPPETAMPDVLPSYEEACQKLANVNLAEDRKQAFLQRLWDFRKSLAPGFRESVGAELKKEWKGMTEAGVPVWDPVWTKLEGHDVMMVPGADYAAIPNGPKSASTFTIMRVSTREELTQLKKSEVRGWLIKMARSDGVKPTGVFEGFPVPAGSKN